MIVASHAHETKSGVIELRNIARLIQRRLSYMPAIAWYKFKNGKGIEEHAQEGILIYKIMQEAQQYRLDPISAQSFFRVQIAAGKTIQHRCFAEWMFTPGFHTSGSTDLTELRQCISQTGSNMLREISAYLRSKQHFSLDDLLTYEEYITDKRLRSHEKMLLLTQLAAIVRVSSEVRHY